MFAKVCILIENTPRSMAMPVGNGTFAVWVHNLFLAYTGLNIIANEGHPIHASH